MSPARLAAGQGSWRGSAHPICSAEPRIERLSAGCTSQKSGPGLQARAQSRSRQAAPQKKVAPSRVPATGGTRGAGGRLQTGPEGAAGGRPLPAGSGGARRSWPHAGAHGRRSQRTFAGPGRDSGRPCQIFLPLWSKSERREPWGGDSLPAPALLLQPSRIQPRPRRGGNRGLTSPPRGPGCLVPLQRG